MLTHPALDWLNNYGMRWLMPFDGRWFYGDALFIIDPWVWLVLGGVLFLVYSQTRLSLVRWTVLGVDRSLVVLANPALVPLPARVLWCLGIGAIVAARWLGFTAARRERALERAAAAALGIVAAYIAATVAANAAARAQVRAALAADGIDGVEQVMIAPSAANPFAGDVVAAASDRYYLGRWHWLERPRFELASESLPRPRGAVFEAAALAPDARDFLTWSRFPVVDVERAAGGELVVQFSDARYRSAQRLGGPAVRLDEDLRVSVPTPE